MGRIDGVSSKHALDSARDDGHHLGDIVTVEASPRERRAHAAEATARTGCIMWALTGRLDRQ